MSQSLEDLLDATLDVRRQHEAERIDRQKAIGDAILDRVVHRAHRIELKGPSLRKRNAVDGAAAVGESLNNTKDK
jgi:IstB-like ATP binding protein